MEVQVNRDNLKELIKNVDLYRLEQRINVSRKTINNWLAGRHKAERDKLIEVCAYFKCDVSLLSLEKNDESTIGKRIIKKLDEIYMTQNELAARIDISDTSMSKWINDTAKPSKKFIKRMAKVLNCSEEYLND